VGGASPVQRVIERLSKGSSELKPALAAFSTLLVGTVLLSEASTEQRPLPTLVALFCALASALDQTRAPALALAAALQALRVVQAFPATANHAYLQLILLLLATLLAGASSAETKQLVSSCRAITAAVFFHAGLQKLVYGAYFDGRMLAVLISKHERYQWAFEPLVGSSEIARLAALSTHLPGQGPFTVDSVLVTVIANATWLLELSIAALLLTPLAVAPWLAAIFMVCIEAAARELVFGVLMLGLLGLFLPAKAARRAQLVLIVLGGALLAVAYGTLPGRNLLFLEALP